jgi:hypothetical protein
LIKNKSGESADKSVGPWAGCNLIKNKSEESANKSVGPWAGCLKFDYSRAREF